MAGGLEDQPLDWHELDLRVLPLTGGPFQFHVERLHRGNDAYYSRLGEAAKLKNAEQAVAATVQAQVRSNSRSSRGYLGLLAIALNCTCFCYLEER